MGDFGRKNALVIINGFVTDEPFLARSPIYWATPLPLSNLEACHRAIYLF
jgi:hypothetical protein